MCAALSLAKSLRFTENWCVLVIVSQMPFWRVAAAFRLLTARGLTRWYARGMGRALWGVLDP